MASPGRILSDLLGTLQTTLKIATNKLQSPSAGLLRAKKDDLTDASLGADGVYLYADNGSNNVRLQPTSGLAQNYILSLPTAITTGQSPSTPTRALTVDSTGQMYVQEVATATNMVFSVEYTLEWNSSVVSPVELMTPSAGMRILAVTVEVETAFSGYTGGTPQLSVYTAAYPPDSAITFMGALENELPYARIYEVACRTEIGNTPRPILLGFSLYNSTAGSARITLEYANEPA